MIANAFYKKIKHNYVEKPITASLIYGYGGYIGGETATLNVSKLRC